MFTKFWIVTLNFVLSVRPLVHMELLSCQWTDFHEIWVVFENLSRRYKFN